MFSGFAAWQHAVEGTTTPTQGVSARKPASMDAPHFCAWVAQCYKAHHDFMLAGVMIRAYAVDILTGLRSTQPAGAAVVPRGALNRVLCAFRTGDAEGLKHVSTPSVLYATTPTPALAQTPTLIHYPTHAAHLFCRYAGSDGDVGSPVETPKQPHPFLGHSNPLYVPTKPPSSLEHQSEALGSPAYSPRMQASHQSRLTSSEGDNAHWLKGSPIHIQRWVTRMSKCWWDAALRLAKRPRSGSP
eukprot:scaffold150132_cov21-Tisochrysis_lutea.AAC.1